MLFIDFGVESSILEDVGRNSLSGRKRWKERLTFKVDDYYEGNKMILELPNSTRVS
jgi:hypothetical protein